MKWYHWFAIIVIAMMLFSFLLKLVAPVLGIVLLYFGIRFALGALGFKPKYCRNCGAKAAYGKYCRNCGERL